MDKSDRFIKMKKYKFVIIILSIFLFLIIGTTSFYVVKNVIAKKQYEMELERSAAERQKEYDERNEKLYNQYSGQWYSKEDDRLFIKLYKDSEGYICISYTTIYEDGTIYENNFRNVALAIGMENWMHDDNEYLQVYYDGICDAGGWIDFLLFDGDDTRLGYDEIIYYKK